MYKWWQNQTTVQRESDLFITSMITDWIGRHEVLLPINHKNYNFREKKNTKVWKEKIYIKNFYTVSMVIETKVVIGWFKLQLKMWLIDLNYNFECDWLVELSNNKLSDNKLSDNKLSDNNLTSELVENRRFLNQSQSRKL